MTKTEERLKGLIVVDDSIEQAGFNVNSISVKHTSSSIKIYLDMPYMIKIESCILYVTVYDSTNNIVDNSNFTTWFYKNDKKSFFVETCSIYNITPSKVSKIIFWAKEK